MQHHLGYESRHRQDSGKWSKWEAVDTGVIDEIHNLFVSRHGFKVTRVMWTNTREERARQWRRVKP